MLQRYSRLQKPCNKQAETVESSIDLLCLNQEEGHAETIRFICGKSIAKAEGGPGILYHVNDVIV